MAIPKRELGRFLRVQLSPVPKTSIPFIGSAKVVEIREGAWVGWDMAIHTVHIYGLLEQNDPLIKRLLSKHSASEGIS